MRLIAKSFIRLMKREEKTSIGINAIKKINIK